MDKKEIIQFFRKDKIFLTPDALEFLSSNQSLVEKVKEKCLSRGVFVVDSGFIERILQEIDEVKIKIEYPERIGEFTINDVISQLKSRYDFLSSILVQNNQLKEVFSISRVIRSKKDFSSGIVIGMVKDKTTYTFTLEDLSGNIAIRGEAGEIEKLSIDDIVGVEVSKEGENFISKKVYYPSFTFFRKIPKLKDEVLISENKIIFKDKVYEIKVEIGARVFVDDVKIWILNYDFFKGYLKENYLEGVCLLLEKRHLCPNISQTKELFKDDFFLLREIPEYLVFVRAKDNSKKIYKGVQIYFLKDKSSVCLKEGKFVF